MMKINWKKIKQHGQLPSAKWVLITILFMNGVSASLAQDTYSVKVKQDTIALELNKPRHSTYDSKTHVVRLKKFVDQVVACDTLSEAQKDEVVQTYKAFLAEHRTVRDSLSDNDVRECSKQKVRYQKAMARIFAVNTADDVSDKAQNVGKKVSKFFKKTGKKIQGAIDGFKEN